LGSALYWKRNGFGAIQGYAAASLALRGDGKPFKPLITGIEPMRKPGLENVLKSRKRPWAAAVKH